MHKEYTLLEKKKIEELNAVGQLFIHGKSGAKLFIISNDDNNKAFSISFRTPPGDDTGLPHILEHSVLCGSRKFPIKDPFVELAKGSLNTFLNAMTFSDKTMYPVASCNDKDFENLMDVYLDAVLYPNIKREDKILKQEGWHYELYEEGEELTYKGVVYNEMKGVFSSPEQTLFRKIQQSLFPDNAYHFESGGDPEFITDLTQENFLDYHKKYYHPSNSYIFIYGDVNVGEKLEWLHNHYLKDFEAIEIDSRIPKQAPFDQRREVIEAYPISSNESLDSKTYLSLNFVTGEITNKCEYVGLEILEYILLEAPGAPLKKALLEAAIGKDVFGSYDNSILQPTFSIVVKNSEEAKKDQFLEVVFKTLQKLSDEGLDKKKIEAAINHFEFKTKEADYGRYPKGVVYAMKSMDSWLYDASPYEHLAFNKTFEELKEGVDNGCFDNLIKKYFLNNNHSTVLILKPDQEMLVKKEEDIKNKLKAYKDSLSPEQLKKLVSETNDLENFQNEKESKENIESIPLLSLDDIKKEIEPMILDEKVINNVRWLRHINFTNNIVYVQFDFDTTKVPMHLLPYIGLLTGIFGKMNTEFYDYGDLSTEININTGGIKFNVNVYGVNDETDVFRPKFELSGKCFSDKVPKLFELSREMLFNTQFEDKKRLAEIVAELKSRMQMSLSSSGHTTAANRAESYFSKAAYYREWVSGVSYYEFLEKCDSNFDSISDEMVKNLKQLVHIIFRPENLIVGVTCEKEALNVLDHEMNIFVESLDHNILSLDDISFELEQRNEGFMTSGKVQYVAKAGNFLLEGHKYSGYLRVLQTILSLDYLWHNVRVKGGAYGCMASFKRSGSMYFVSYRDPNLKETLEVYDNMFSYISTFSGDEREMRKYIIGTISKLDQPLTPSMKNDKMISLYFGNISGEHLQKERDEVLTTTPEQIRELAFLIKDTLKQDNVCVLGNEKKVEELKVLFGETKHLFN
ncbi:MAG: peptidase M16 [Firmicutes bacterium HGW-Firmicutes-1]|jgi:hypothetical protein|nr:MAG: peptidase M16 [Firmicutes bacterium HGW-Firmicutes-1]